MKKYILLLICFISLQAEKAFAQPANDECATAQNLGTLPAPAACPSGLGAAVNVAGTIVAATPSNPYIYQNGCSGAGGPGMGIPASDVWYSYVASGYEAVISITSTFANPNIAVYAGSCASLGGGVGGCAVGTGGAVTLTVEQMVIGTTYYIQVSGNVGQSGTFNLSVKNNKSCSDCINSTTLSVSPLPVNGMYNPGQTVHFCYHINTYAEINTNWLHGVQVGLGSGWNSSSVVASPVVSSDCGTWTYYTAGITDPSGQPWPAGFYFNRTCAPLGGGTATDGIPGNNFGDHVVANTTGDQTVYTIPAGTWNFCFDVTVASGCSPGSNLSITINTSGDGESGPWTSAGCATDPATPFNAVGACCMPTMTSTPATCAGNDGSATATPVGSSGPYTYSWTNSGGTVIATSLTVPGSNTVMGLAPGVYTVTLTNALNCAVTNTVTVTGAAGGPAVPTAGSNSPVCAGSNLSLTAATVTGATYSWTGPNTFASTTQNPSVPSVTAAAAGTYTVVATVSGCTSSSTVAVVINPVPVVTVPANITVCNGATVAAAAFTSTPTGATFAWTNANTAIGLAAGGTGNAHSFTATNTGAASISGTVTVTPTLAGCTGTPATYTITVNPIPTVTVPANITACNGASVPATTFTSNVTGATFTWANSNTAIGIAASGTGNVPAFTTTNTGTTAITATITVTPAAGCPGTPNSYTITVNPTPNVTVPANITVCNGSSIAATAFTSNVTGATFTWTNSNTAIGLGASGTGDLAAFNGTNTGTAPIIATIAVTPTAGTCSGTPVTYTITVNPDLVVNAGPDDTICFNGSTVLTATPHATGSTYSWSPVTGLTGAATYNPTANPAATTNYTVTITDAAGCSGTDNVTVYSDPQILIAKTAIDVTCFGACNGQTIVIPNGGSGIFSYSWTSGCTTASCTGLCPGSYTVTITDSWGCTALADTSVAQPAAVVAAITGQTPTSCFGVCDGTATASGSGGTPGTGYGYSWNTTPAQTTATATALCAGAYTLTVTDSKGCSATAGTTITQPTAVTVPPIPPVTICIGSSSTITAAPAGGNGSYHYGWLPVGTGGDVASVTVSPVVTTTYTVNVTDGNGCTAPPLSAIVNVNPPLTVIASGATSVCPGSAAPISAIASGGDGGPYTYTWGPLGTPSGSPVTVAPTSNTTYTVIATDNCGTPFAIDSVALTLLPVPVVAFAADTTHGCVPLCVNFTDSSTIASGSITGWSWDFGGDGTSSVQDPVTHCFNNPGLYSITLTVSTAQGCTATYTNTNMINVFALPTAAFTAAPNPASVLNSTVNFGNQSSSDVVGWSWTYGDGDSLSPGIPDPTHQYPNAVASGYNATLTVHNSHQCYATVTHTIDIGPEFTFFIPNAFTPNGDGINDYFNGTGIGIDEYNLYIFDRWGNLIYTTDSLNKPWDGKANHGSEMAQEDVYVWKVKLTDVFGKKHNYIGTVTIVK